MDKKLSRCGARAPAANALVSMPIGSGWVHGDISDDWDESDLWDLSGKVPS